MALIVVGVSHHLASLDIRERLALRAAEVEPLIARLREARGIVEAVVLSTCNRTEVYVVEGDGNGDAARDVLEIYSQRLSEDATPYSYVQRDRDAVTHLFRVASGLDSMIVGEAQIHGQVRTAWESCRASSGAVLNRLFQTALLVAGRVRSETAIGRGAASISSAAVQLSKQIFGSLAGKRAMVLGAGEMAEVALECLTNEGVRAAIVANRTFDRAQRLAEQFGARAIGYEECWSALHDVDVLLCSTASPRPVVSAANVAPALAARRDRPLCILDIAMPRDVEPSVGALDNVYLYDLDDLHAIVSSNLERRRNELPAAEHLILEETSRYWDWVAGLAVVPVLTSFRSRMNDLRERELEQAMRKLGDLPPEHRAVVEQLSRSLMNKFLHEPTVRLRTAAANGRGLGIVDAVRYLFALGEPAAPDEKDEPREARTVSKGE